MHSEIRRREESHENGVKHSGLNVIMCQQVALSLTVADEYELSFILAAEKCQLCRHMMLNSCGLLRSVPLEGH